MVYSKYFRLSELPSDLEPYRIHIPIQRMHDVQAAAALFVGESATMASESVVLGTPAIYIDEVGRGYTDEEARHSLLWMFRPVANRNSLIIEDQKNTEKNTELSADTDSIQNVTAPQSACEQAPRQTDDPFRSTDIVAQSLSDNPVQKTQKIISSNEVGPRKVEPWWISGGVQECIAKAEEIADAKFDAAAYAKRHKAWMATKIDCTAFITWFIEHYPASVNQTRSADANFWQQFK